MAQKEARQLTDREHCRAKVGVYLGGGQESENPFISGMSDEELQKLGKETTLYTAFREAIDNSLDMMIEGDATEVYIFKDKTKNPTSIKKIGSKDISKIKTWYQYIVGDNGSGIPIKQMINVNTKEKQTTADNVVSNLKSGTKFKKDKSLIGTNGMGVSCTNFTSLTFSVYSRLSCSDVTKSTKLVQNLYAKNKLNKTKDKYWYYKVTYELGLKVSEELINLNEEDSIVADHFRKLKIYPSTITSFIPDVTIHEGIDCDISTNYGYLKVMNPNLKFYVNGKEDKYKPEEYDFDFSVKVLSQVEDDDNPNPYMNFNGSIGIAEDLKNYEHNFSVNYLASQKGFHVDAMKDGFTKAFCDYFKDWEIEKYVTEGLNILCIADSPTPSFNGQAKERCTKIEGIKKDQCIEALSKSFSKIIKANNGIFEKHYERIRAYVNAKVNAGKLKELQGILGDMANGKNKSSSKYMPKKLNDAQFDDRSKTEVFLCFTGDTEVLDCNNQRYKFTDLVKMDFNKNPIYTFSCDSSGVLYPSKIVSCKQYQEVTETVKITLDNGETFECTPDHKMLMKNGEYKEAKNLVKEDSCMPIYFSEVEDNLSYGGCKRRTVKSMKNSDYDRPVGPKNSDGTYNYLVYRIMKKHTDVIDNSVVNDKTVVHHADCNPLNDYPNNLALVANKWHKAYHGGIGNLNSYKNGKFNRFFGTDNDKRKSQSAAQIKHYSTVNGKKHKKLLSKIAKEQWNNEELRKWKSDNVKIYAKNHHEQLSENAYKGKETAFKNNVDKISKYLEKQNIEKTYFNAYFYGRKLGFDKFNPLLSLYTAKYMENYVDDFKESLETFMKYCLENELHVNITNFNVYISKKYGKKAMITSNGYYNFRNNFRTLFEKYEQKCNKNHKVISIEFKHYKNSIPVYCLTVDNKLHNFPLAAGIFTKNCEGDSASGGFVKAKTGYPHVAVMGLRGNILNTVGMDISDALDKNKEIADITFMSGGVDGVHLDISKLYFGKYIIASDADSDGAHIASLLLGYWMQHSSFMFGTKENDYNDSVIYRAEAPLYAFRKVNGTNENKYFYAGEEKQMNEWKKHNKYKSETRFKGIGEVSPKEIQELYLNPSTRRLIQIKPQNIEESLLLINPNEDGKIARQDLMVDKGIWSKDVIDLTELIEEKSATKTKNSINKKKLKVLRTKKRK